MLSTIITVLISVTILYGLLKLWWKNRIEKFNFLPGPASIPVLGTALLMEYDAHKQFKQLRELSRKHNHLYLLWFGYKPVIMAGCVSYAQVVLSSQVILKKSSMYAFAHEWIGTGLLTSEGKKWKSRRRAITPTFHFAILKEFMCIFEVQAKRLVEKFRVLADTGEAVDVQVPVSLAMLDVICETSMGVQINAQDSTHSEYVQALKSASFELNMRQKSPWLWPQIIYPYTSTGKKFYKSLKSLKHFTAGVINERIESRKLSRKHGNHTDTQSNDEVSGEKKKFFLDMLLDLYDKGEINVEGITEEVDTLMVGGHDTTAAGLSWVLYLLGRHPEVQEKLHAEIDKWSEGDNILDKIRNMKYLEYVIKEALRLHPPAPYFGRNFEQDIKIDGHVLPKGTDIIIDIMGLHTNPEYWEDPLTFNPDRFGGEMFAKRNPYTYVPFSAGPRNCIGQKFAMLEEKTFVYYIMSNFQIKSVQDEGIVKENMDIIHNSANGLYVQFYNRDWLAI